MNKKELQKLIFGGVALAMGIAVIVLSVLRELESDSAVMMLGIGLAALAMSSLLKDNI